MLDGTQQTIKDRHHMAEFYLLGGEKPVKHLGRVVFDFNGN